MTQDARFRVPLFAETFPKDLQDGGHSKENGTKKCRLLMNVRFLIYICQKYKCFYEVVVMVLRMFILFRLQQWCLAALIYKEYQK